MCTTPSSMGAIGHTLQGYLTVNATSHCQKILLHNDLIGPSAPLGPVLLHFSVHMDHLAKTTVFWLQIQICTREDISEDLL